MFNVVPEQYENMQYNPSIIQDQGQHVGTKMNLYQNSGTTLNKLKAYESH